LPPVVDAAAQGNLGHSRPKQHGKTDGVSVGFDCALIVYLKGCGP